MNKTKKILILFLLGCCENSVKSGFNPLNFFNKKKQGSTEKTLDEKDFYKEEDNQKNQEKDLCKKEDTKNNNQNISKENKKNIQKKTNIKYFNFSKIFSIKKNTQDIPLIKNQNNIPLIKNQKNFVTKPCEKKENKKNSFFSFDFQKVLTFKQKPKFKTSVENIKKDSTLKIASLDKKESRWNQSMIPTSIDGGNLDKPERNTLENQQQVLSLQDVVRHALETDLNVQKASLEVKKASENLSKAMTGWRPSMNIDGGGSYSHLNDVNLLNDQTAINHKWIHEVSTNVGYDLFSGGQVVYSVKAARLRLSGAILNYFATLQDVIASLTKAYIEVISLTREVQIYKNFMPYSEKAYTHAKAQYDFGLAKYTDLANAAMNFSNHINTFNNRRAKLVEARANLEQQGGFLLGDELKEVPSVSNPKTLREAMEIAKKNNPHFQALLKEEEATTYDLKSATGKFAPVVSAKGGVNFNNRNITGVQDDLGYASGVEAGLSFRLPVPINGEIQAEVRNVRLNVNSARIELEKFRREVWAILRQLYSQYTRNTDSLAFLERSNVLAKKSLEASQEEFISGLMDMTTLVEIQNNALKSEIEYNSIRYNLQEISYEISKNIGQLTPESLGISHEALYTPYIKRYQNSILNIRVKDSESEKKAFHISKNLYNLSSMGDI